MKTAETSRKKKLLKDIGIYSIGSLGSKLITFMLVPLYTYYITDTAAFGYYDICLTVIFCLTPVLSLQLNDGGFRFLLETDNADRRRAIVTYVYRTLARNSAIFVLATIIIGIFSSIRFLPYIVIFGILQSVYETVIQLVRGLGRTKHFVAAGIVNSFLIALFSLLFVALLDLSIEGIFLANICAKIITLTLLECRLHLLTRYFSTSIPARAIGREMLRYCLPLLPGTICWWLIGGNNKFFIEHYLGLEENGLYAVALKFASILQIIVTIFYQAWQQNAIEQYNSPDRNEFFTKVFNSYILLLTAITVLFSFGLRINYFWLVGPEYQQSSQYIFLLSLSTVIYALSMFYDLGYQCSKHTARTLPSVFIATAANIAGNYFLIQLFNIYGIILSSIITYAILVVYRAIDTKKYFRLKISPRTVTAIATMLCAGFIYQTSANSMAADAVALTAAIAVFAAIVPAETRKALMRKIMHKARP